MGDSSALKAYIANLKEISKQVLMELNNLTKKFSQLARLMIQNLDEYEWKCSVILENFENHCGEFDINEVKNWTIPKLKINKNITFENIFELEGICDGFLIALQKITSCVYHPETTTKTLKCKKKHCLECLKEALSSNIEMCPCGKPLSKKDMMEISKTPNIFNRKIIA